MVTNILPKQGKLNYLTLTRPNISFVASVVRQLLSSPFQKHADVAIQILKYNKGALVKGLIYDKGQTQLGRLTFVYCLLLRGNLVY